MPENPDNTTAFDYITAVRYLIYCEIVVPELYSEFNKIMAGQGAKSWSPDDQGFIAALKIFSHRYEEYKKNHPETVKIDSVAPKAFVEKVFSEADSYHAKIRQNEVGTIVDAYANKIKEGAKLANEEAVKKALTESLLMASEKAMSATELADQTKANINQDPELAGQIKSQVLDEVIDSHKDKIAWFARDEEVKSRIVEDALTSTTEMKHARARVVTGMLAENPNLDQLTLKKDADRLTLLASGLLVDAHPDIGGKLDALVKTVVNTAGDKSAQLVVGAANSALGKERAYAVWEMATGQAFKKIADDPKAASVIASSPTLTKFLETSQKITEASDVSRYNLIKRWAAAAVLGQAAETSKQTVQDLARLGKYGVFNRDMMTGITKAVDTNGGLTMSTSASARLNAPSTPGVAMFIISTQQLFLAAVYAHAPTAFHIDFSAVSGWTLSLGVRTVGEKATAGAAALGVKIGTGAAVQKFIGGVVGTLLGGPGVGTVVGTAITGFVGGLIGKAAGFIKGTVGLGGEGSRLLKDDMPLAFAAGSVALLILMIYLPFTFAPFNNLSDKVRTAALETSGEKAVGGGAGPNLAKYDYPEVNVSNKSSITRCPIDQAAGEHITQGPNQGNHTGDEANSYDIGLSQNVPVHPSHSGVIVEISYSANIGQSEGNLSPGNYVQVKGAAADGQVYFTTYEHLFDVTGGLVKGSVVTPETVLGYSDNTGNSSGPHLHYQCNGPICGSMMPVGCGT